MDNVGDSLLHSDNGECFAQRMNTMADHAFELISYAAILSITSKRFVDSREVTSATPNLEGTLNISGCSAGD